MYSRQTTISDALNLIKQNNLNTTDEMGTNISALIKKSDNAMSMALFFIKMNQLGLLNNALFDQIETQRHHIHHIFATLDIFHQHGCFETTEFRDQIQNIITHPRPQQLRHLINAIHTQAQKENKSIQQIVVPNMLNVLLHEQDSLKLDTLIKIVSTDDYRPLFVAQKADLYFGMLAQHTAPECLVVGLLLLKQAGLLDALHAPLLLNHVIQHSNPVHLSNAYISLFHLQCVELPFYYTLVAQYPDPLTLVSSFIDIKREGVFNQFSAIRCMEILAVTPLSFLNIKTQTIIQLYTKTPYLFKTAYEKHLDSILKNNTHHTTTIEKIISILSRVKLFDGQFGYQNLITTLSSQSPRDTMSILINLNKHHLLSGEKAAKHRQWITEQNDHARLYTLTRTFVCDMDYPEDIAVALQKKKENFKFLCQHPNLRSLAALLSPFRGINDQRVIDTIQAYSFILNDDLVTHPTWLTLHERSLTLDQFLHIRDLCRQPQNNPQHIRTTILNFIHLILHGQTRTLNQINLTTDTQSTHTASVHESISNSAMKLSNHYMPQIKNHDIATTQYTELLGWIKTTSNQSFQSTTANKCIERMSRDQTLYYQDPVSQVSVKTLLILFWLLIHDNDSRIGSAEDAKNNLINGLYEIQRGYALNEHGQDNNQSKKDVPICAGGTFNKLIEKMIGLTDCVEVIHLSIATALPKIKASIKHHLHQLLTSEKDSLLISHVQTTIQQDTIESSLWEKIKQQVRSDVDAEFFSIRAKLETVFTHIESLELNLTEKDVEKLSSAASHPFRVQNTMTRMPHA